MMLDRADPDAHIVKAKAGACTACWRGPAKLDRSFDLGESIHGKP